MSEWSTSLYYSAGDFFPGDDGDDEDEVMGASIQQPAPTALDEEQIKFVDTPFTIAARNAQMRKARQPFESIDRNVPSVAVDHRRATPVEPTEDIEDAIAIEAMQAFESLNAPVETPTPLAPQHDIRHPTVQNKIPSIPSEVIVVSSDSDDDDLVSTRGIHGSTDTQPSRRGPTQGPTEIASKRALQLMLDRDQEFYESLERDLAQRETQRYMSEASSSSARMESMVPDASTSYDTSSWAPTRTNYSHETYPVAPLEPARNPALQPHQAYYAPPRVPTPINPQVVYDAYGNPMQPVYLAPPPALPSDAYPAYMLAPTMSQSSSYVYQDVRPASATGYRPDSRHHPLYQPAYYPQHQRSWSGSASPTPVAYPPQHMGSDRASLTSYARPKTPRQALEDKAKTDLVYKALQGASKRARTKSAAQVGPSSLAKGKEKENEWSTLKALRAGPDRSLSLTAALRRPLPATRLAHGIRGGSRLALPLYRNPGSSPEERRRAETALSQCSSKQGQAESSSNPRLWHVADGSRPPKLFRPTPLTEAERNPPK